MRAVVGILAASLLASPALAQSSSGGWTGLPDRFQIDTGYFHLNRRDPAPLQRSAGRSGDVSLEKDLGVDKNVDTFWVDATWRVGRRHQLKLGYTQLDRDRADYQLQRDFTWGGQVYQAGLSAHTSTGADVLGGYYRFALVRNDRFEIGPTVGIGYLWLNARIQATGTVAAGAEPLARPEGLDPGSVTGAVGGYAERLAREAPRHAARTSCTSR